MTSFGAARLGAQARTLRSKAYNGMQMKDVLFVIAA